MKAKARGSNVNRQQSVRDFKHSVSRGTAMHDPVQTAKSDAKASVKKFEKDFQEIGKALRK